MAFPPVQTAPSRLAAAETLASLPAVTLPEIPAKDVSVTFWVAYTPHR